MINKSLFVSLRFAFNTTENEPFESENELKPPGKHTYSHTLTLINATKEHNGSYLCHFPETEKEKNATMQISFSVVTVLMPRIVPPINQEIEIKEKDSKSVELLCVIEASPTALFNGSVKWEKETIDRLENMDSSTSSEINAVIANRTKVATNETHITVSVFIDKASKKHNGTYICTVAQPLALDKPFEKVEKRVSILIQSAPIAMISFVKAIGKDRIFLNWTVTDDGNSPIEMFLPQYKTEKDASFHYLRDKVGANQTMLVIEKLAADTVYMFRIAAKNGIDTGPVTDWSTNVKTLTENPVFTPIVEVKGNSHSTITIGWQPPSPDLLNFIHYYEVVVFQSDNKTVEEAIHPQNSRNLPYMVINLKTATEYFFRVRACSEYNKECGNWSETVNGTTMDGTSSAPLDVKISCIHHNVSRRNLVTVDWSSPSNPNGIVVSYQVLLEGTAYFKSDAGVFVNQTFGPKAKNVDGQQDTKAMYDNVPANTNYSVSVAAITRSKKPGEKASASCTMPTTLPDSVPKATLGKVQADFNWIFKLFLPRITERNGKVCCYRIYMIRVGKKNLEKSPEDMDIVTYEDAHNSSVNGGAYLANIVSNYQYQSEIFLGSGKRYKYLKSLYNDKCRGCLTSIVKKRAQLAPVSDDEEEEEKEQEAGIIESTEETKAEVETKTRRRRHGQSEQSEPKPLNILDSLSLNHAIERSSDSVDVFDGPLDSNSNYSGFVEVIVENEDESDDKVLSVYGDYFQQLSPKAPVMPDEPPDQMLVVITYLLAGLIVLVISLFFLLCLLHRYQKKHIMQGNEVVSLTDSLRLLCHGGRANHHQHRSLNTVSKPPDLPPIPRENLPQSYVDRHKDSDYGFQHEFELLPDRFTDRTSRSGDMKENIFKNRYPDIKCYDQTRVKLSNLNGLVGSDYINANFVIGYKERKKFICAQGPMDSTITDFWRMIWEQHLEIIIMLTNLEEYNKTKCAKYWPERVTDAIQFGEINVSFESEQRFSDYLIRNIKVSHLSVLSDVDVIKHIKFQLTRKNPNADAEAPEEPSRNITQFHYLVWKDFQAPEHPYGILKFIRTINSEYSVQRGPLLIHCSAGVGRTGTLVALDSLIQQLNEEGQVAIFNTICDMRHQRNYLVQSLVRFLCIIKWTAVLILLIF